MAQDTASRAEPVVAEPGARPAGERAPWLIAGAVCTTVMLAIGCLTVLSWLARGGQNHHRVLAHQVDRIIVELDSGFVTLRSGAAGQVTLDRFLTWSVVKPVVDETWAGGTLHVRGRCPSALRMRCTVGYDIRVPPGVAVETTVKVGDISIRDLAGPLQLSARTGDIDVTGASGPLTARSGSGDVTAENTASGTVDAWSDSGNVLLNFRLPPDRARAETISGNAEITVPRGQAYAVDAETTAGTRRVMRGDPASPHKLVVRAVSGNVVVTHAAY